MDAMTDIAAKIIMLLLVERRRGGGVAIRFHSIGPNGKKASFIAYT